MTEPELRYRVGCLEHLLRMALNALTVEDADRAAGGAERRWSRLAEQVTTVLQQRER